MDRSRTNPRPRPIGRFRRWLLTLLAMLLAIPWSLALPSREVAARQPEPACAPGVGFAGYSEALDKAEFEDTSIGGLSAIAWDQVNGVAYALLDNQGDNPARFYTLSLPFDDTGALGDVQVEAVTLLTDADGVPFVGTNFDGEGMTLTQDGELLISSEVEPSIRRFGLDGRLLAELPVPDRFLIAPDGEATDNETFESLALSPDGRSLYTAVEGPLAPDSTTDNGAYRIRILRYDRAGNGSFDPAAEYFYLTEPDQNVSDLIALSGGQLLVLERGVSLVTGFVSRVFRVPTADAPDVSGEASLAETSVAPLAKQLLVDLGACEANDVTSPSGQSFPFNDNYEGIALGPALVGGKRALLFISDDNFNSFQVTQIVALTVKNQLRGRALPARPIRRDA